MKKTLRLVAVFALMGATLAYTGCTDYSKDFDDINNRIEALESGKLKSVEEQVAGLKSTVASLEDAKSKAEAAIADLQKNSASAADVDALKSKVADLEKAITDAKALIDTKYATVNEKVGALTAWQTETIAKLGKIEGSIAEIIEGLQTTQGDVSNLSEGLKATKAGLGIAEENIKSLQTDMKEVKDALDAIKSAYLTKDAAASLYQTADQVAAAVSDAIQKAIANNGVIDAAIAAAVKEATDKLQAQIDALNNVVKNLAEQVQSIVYVPETAAGKMKAVGYAFGDPSNANTEKTDIMVKATYEVSPKYLAGVIEESNLFFSGVKVKAAPAETFAAKIAEADANTGRLVVYALIPAETEAYKQLLVTGNTNNDNNNIALALNVADEDKVTEIVFGEEKAEVDAGTYVSSTYTTVEPDQPVFINVYNQVKVYNTKKKDYSASNENETINVPFNVTDSKTLFGDFEVRVDLEDQPMTVAEASAFLGKTLTLTNQCEIKYYNPSNNQLNPNKDDDKKYIPIAVKASKNNAFEASAQITGAEKVSGAAMIGYYATVTLKTFKVNNVRFGNTYTSTFTIDKKEADIVIPSGSKNWIYTDGTSTAFSSDELTVSGIADFSSLTVGSWDVERYVDGKKVDGSKTPTITVTPKSKQIVTVVLTNLEYAKGKNATYKFSTTATDKANTTTYTVAYEFTLSPMPEDKDIDLGTINVAGSYSTDMVASVSPIAKTFTTDQAYFAGVTEADLLTYYLNNNQPDNIVVTVGDKVKSAYASFAIGYDTKNSVETSAITLTKANFGYTDAVKISYPVKVWGVTYTYKATVKLSKPAYSLEANPVYVKNGEVQLDGTANFDIKYNYAVPVSASSSNFALNEINLAKYFNIKGFDGKENLTVDYKLNTEIAEGDPTGIYKLPKAGTDFAATAAVTAKGINKNILKWTTNGRELEFTATLRATNNKDEETNTFGSVKIKLVAPKVITEFKGGVLAVEHVAGSKTPVELATALTATDLLGNVIVNENTTSLADMWHYTYKNAYGAVTTLTENFWKVYGQDVVFAAQEDVKVYHEGAEISQSQVSFTYVKENGTLTLNGDNAKFNGTLKFEIPVSLNYYLDYSHKDAIPATVVVEFKQK